MGGSITINGKPVEGADNQKLLKHLLDTSTSVHNNDDNIDAQEAQRLIDINNNGSIDGSDLMACFQKKFTVNGVKKLAGLFSAAGIAEIPFNDTDIKETLMDLARNDPTMALIKFRHFHNQPYAAEVIMIAAEKEPRTAIQHSDFFRDQPYAADVLRMAAEKDPEAAIFFAKHYKGQPYTAEILKIAASKEPAYALDHANKFDGESYTADIIVLAAETSPASAVKFQYPNWIYETIKQSQSRVCKAITAIVDTDYSDTVAYTDGEKKRISTLIDKIVLGELTVEATGEIARDDKRYLNALVEVSLRPGAIGRHDIEIELGNMFLRLAIEINYLHESSDNIRFNSVKDASAEKLYTSMVYAEEEVFTSTFKGLFKRLINRMKKDGLTGDQLLDRLGHRHFRTFIRLCASYDRLNEFLSTMPEDKQRELLVSFVSGIDKSREMLSDAVTVADAFGSINDPKILSILQDTIKREFDRVSKEENKEAKSIYGLLAGLFGKKAVINEEWMREMSRTHQLPDITGIKSEELFNSEGKNIQQYFFYEDADGKASFESFIGSYKDKPGWTIEDKGTYVIIRSAKVNGRSVEMYANKPTDEAVEVGPEDIRTFFEQNNIEPAVAVHRGHSYHALKTIERIPKSVKIVSLGSYGGYQNVTEVLERAPSAHIISTKGTGTMKVNDPLFKMLNEAILKGDIDWTKLWSDATRRYGTIEEFGSYVPPHRNLGVLFLKAYNSLSNQL